MLEIYTAGFLDADGSVSLGTHSQRPLQTEVQVDFYNCDKHLLEKIQERWGGAIIERLPEKSNHNISYTLKIRGKKALNLLKDVSPYMLHNKKSTRAKLLVDNYENVTPKNGKYTTEQICKKLALIEDFKKIIMRGKGAY